MKKTQKVKFLVYHEREWLKTCVKSDFLFSKFHLFCTFTNIPKDRPSSIDLGFGQDIHTDFPLKDGASMDDQTRISKSINHAPNQLEHLYPSIFGLSPDVKLSSIVLPSSGYRHLYRDLSTFIAKENARPRLIREPSVDVNELQKQQLSLQGKNDGFMVSC